MTQHNGLVSVVIPVRDGAETIGAQLDALASQSYAGRWELVVYLNASAPMKKKRPPASSFVPK